MTLICIATCKPPKRIDLLAFIAWEESNFNFMDYVFDLEVYVNISCIYTVSTLVLLVTVLSESSVVS